MKKTTIGVINSDVKFKARSFELKQMLNIFSIAMMIDKDKSSKKSPVLKDSKEIAMMLVSNKKNNPSYIFWNCKLLQYTGKKDKNGKEIYEGDIIQVVSFDGKTYIEKVPSIFEYHFFYELDDMTDIEIIGNIYENSDLLKN